MTHDQPSPSSVVVIGTVSLDVLHVGGDTVHTVGGAGLYTALAARKAGASVTLVAPRPEPLPARLQPIAERVRWRGPVISPEDLPRLEIAHHGDGRATLLNASWGAESQLTPHHLPTDLHQAAYVHIAALSTAQRQCDFVQAIRAIPDESTRLRVSVGTYARLVYSDIAGVRQLVARADVMFMNENEATGLFGSVDQARPHPHAQLFVTLGAQGVLVMTADEVTHLSAPVVTEVDPTGAGDTFCGATLAGLARQAAPVRAAEQAIQLASQTVAALGPAALW